MSQESLRAKGLILQPRKIQHPSYSAAYSPYRGKRENILRAGGPPHASGSPAADLTP